MQTLVLARLCTGGRITAVDIHQPFLDDVAGRAKAAGLSGRITTVRASMDDLPFGPGSFDLVWSEGAAFVMGFDNALRVWKGLLAPGGSVVVSELVWFTDTPTTECRKYFEEKYPAIRTEAGVKEAIRAAGYKFFGSFRLPASGWWDHYYTPLSRRIDLLEGENRGNEEAMALYQDVREEIVVYRRYSDEYGYAFFVMGG